MNNFLTWLTRRTESCWWNDSANMEELHGAISSGASGVTTNPSLAAAELYANYEYWKPYLGGIPAALPAERKAEEILQRITVRIADLFISVYESTKGRQGYVCAQVNPLLAADRDCMLEMALRLTSWAPNIAVKLPVTVAGLDVLEECVARGIATVATVSFTVPQVVEIGRRCRAGMERAKQSGIHPARCFAVVMVGRLDDYIREVVSDGKFEISESDVIQCGTAVIKRAYHIYAEQKYPVELMPAGMRGSYHATALAGAKMSMSVHPKIQKMLVEIPEPYERGINEPVDIRTIGRLMRVPEFRRAYEPDGMYPEEFITYGVVQKTLAQFSENWMRIESFTL